VKGTFARLGTGRLRTRTIERGSRLLLETGAAAPVGAVALDRPDASLVLLLATWLTWEDFSSDVV